MKIGLFFHKVFTIDNSSVFFFICTSVKESARVDDLFKKDANNITFNNSFRYCNKSDLAELQNYDFFKKETQNENQQK